MLGEALSRRTSFTVLQGRRNVGGKGHLSPPPRFWQNMPTILDLTRGVECLKIWRASNNMGGGHNLPPMVEIGLTALQNLGDIPGSAIPLPLPRIFIPSAGSLTYWHSAVRSLIFVPKSEGIAEAFCLSPTVNWQAGCCMKANSRSG